MKASNLKDFLLKIESELIYSGRTLEDVDVNFRYHNDSEDIQTKSCRRGSV